MVTLEHIDELSKEYIQIKCKDRRRLLELKEKLGITHVAESFLYLYFKMLRDRDAPSSALPAPQD